MCFSTIDLNKLVKLLILLRYVIKKVLALDLEILRSITSAANSSLLKINKPLIPETVKSFTPKYYQFALKSTEPSYSICNFLILVGDRNFNNLLQKES